MFVYIIRARGLDLYKLGASKLPSGRLRLLTAQSPIALELVATVQFEHTRAARRIEKIVQRELAAQRHHGEWFTLSSEQLQETLDLLNKLSAEQGR